MWAARGCMWAGGAQAARGYESSQATPDVNSVFAECSEIRPPSPRQIPRAHSTQEASLELCQRTLQGCGFRLDDGRSSPCARCDAHASPPQYRDAAGRSARLLLGDLRDERVLATAGGGFDVVTANPPYMRLLQQKLPRHPQRRYCNYELRGGVFDFACAAARQLVAKGIFALVHRHDRAGDCVAAVASAGFVPRKRLVATARGSPKWVVLISTWEGDAEQQRSPSACEPEEEERLSIRNEEGAWTPEWSSICRCMGVFQKEGW